MLSDPFVSPKRRLARAKQHFEILDSEIVDFLKNNECIAVIEKEADGKREIHKLRLAKGPPDTLVDSTVETIEALRAALDQASFICCRAMHGPKRYGTHFPIGETAADVDRALTNGQSKYVPPDIATLFRSFRPYHGGNNAIWALNRLCNHGKHRLLIPVAAAIGGIGLNGTSMAGLAIPAYPIWDSEKNEITVLTCNVGTNPQYNLQMTLHIAFDEIEEFAGEPVDGVLRLIIDEVERIIAATEMEARRAGLI